MSDLDEWQLAWLKRNGVLTTEEARLRLMSGVIVESTATVLDENRVDVIHQVGSCTLNDLLIARGDAPVEGGNTRFYLTDAYGVDHTNETYLQTLLEPVRQDVAPSPPMDYYPSIPDSED